MPRRSLTDCTICGLPLPHKHYLSDILAFSPWPLNQGYQKFFSQRAVSASSDGNHFHTLKRKRDEATIRERLHPAVFGECDR